jgi:hypothetical protein
MKKKAVKAKCKSKIKKVHVKHVEKLPEPDAYLIDMSAEVAGVPEPPIEDPPAEPFEIFGENLLDERPIDLKDGRPSEAPQKNSWGAWLKHLWYGE